MSTYKIYRITNAITGRSYIGCTVNLRQRLHAHISVCAPWVDTDFTVDVIGEAKTREDAGRLEAAFIVEHGTLEPHGYNRTTGGFEGYKHHPLTLELISSTPRKPYAKKAPRTPEHAAAQGASLKRTWETREHPWVGRKHTEETKRIIGEKNRAALTGRPGTPHTEETKQKMRDRKAERRAAGLKPVRAPMSEETKQRIRDSKRAAREARLSAT